MKIDKIEVLGMDWALNAMREPYRSQGKSNPEKDIILARSLRAAGPEHRKYLRQVTIQIGMEASMAFWFEFDTYKVGVTSNSESFWNTLGNRELILEDFIVPSDDVREVLCTIIGLINSKRYLDKEVLRYLIPQGVKYHRIVTMTGEAYLNMVKQRSNHRLGEWRAFVDKTMEELMCSPRESDGHRLYEILFYDFGKTLVK